MINPLKDSKNMSQERSRIKGRSPHFCKTTLKCDNSSLLSIHKTNLTSETTFLKRPLFSDKTSDRSRQVLLKINNKALDGLKSLWFVLAGFNHRQKYI